MRTEFQFGKVTEFWRWMVVTVTHDNVSVLHANQPYAQKDKMVNFTVCMCYHKRKDEGEKVGQAAWVL